MAGFLAVLTVAILVFVVILVVILGLGIGLGYTLRWVWPAIDPGTGILIGVVTAGVTLHYFFRVLNFLELLPTPIDPGLLLSNKGADKDEDEDEHDEPPIIYERSQKRWRERRRRRR